MRNDEGPAGMTFMDLDDLRIRLTFTFIVLSVLPLAAFGVVGYVKGVEMVRDKAVSHLESIVDKDAGMIGRFLLERTGDLRLFSKSIIGARSFDGGVLKKRLTTLQESYGVYDAIFLVSPTGRVIVRTGKEATPFQISTKDPWFQSAVTRGTFIGEQFSGDSGKGTTIVVAVPVRDQSGSLMSVLAAHVNTDVLNSVLMETNIGETGEVYVLNKDGYFLTTTKVGGRRVGDRATPEGASEYFKEIGRKEYIDYRGIRVIRAYRKLPELGWIIVGEQDADEAFLQINSLRFSIAAFIAILITLTSFIGYVVSNVVVRLLKNAYRHRKELEFQMIQKDRLASMGLLTAGIAHEINTPLANALLSAQLLKEDVEKLWPEHLPALNSIEEEIRRGSNIVRTLLEFSRQSRIETTEVDVNEVITRLLDMAGRQCAERGIVLKSSLGKDLPMVRGDASVLYQVFLNIVVNAMEAMESGGTLEIVTRHVPVLQRVKVEIQDTGKGIPKDLVGKVFDPFFTTKKIGEGTGLGLAVSYSMVKKMGGNIRVISLCRGEEGVEREGPSGTTFVIELPVVQESMGA